MFIVSAKTPSKNTLNSFGYSSGHEKGIFKSEYPVLNLITIISLNDLSDNTYNAFSKIFASKKKEKLIAFGILKQTGIARLPENVQKFLLKVANFLFSKGGDPDMEFTQEEKKFMAKMLDEFIIPNTPVEKMLSRYSPKERMAGLKIKEIEECLRELKAKDNRYQ
ncbi:hypothetical protein QUF76_03195 [Desulfobacterales bacterium HSG16]|nr:hypothetical protein [Desulfobacterales bacterium HSG16]